VTPFPRGAGLLLSVAFSCGTRAWALDPNKSISQYNQETWTTVEGLPQASVQAIAQTKDGYLWLGTRAGVVRFNGQSFTVFDPANTPAIEGRIVQSLLAGSDGSLWIGTDGMNVTRYKDGAFQTFGPAQAFDADSGNDLYEDETGTLWFATWNGVLRFDHFTTSQGLRATVVTALAEDRDGNEYPDLADRVLAAGKEREGGDR